MKLLVTSLLTLSLLTPLSAKTITIARSGTQPSRPGPAENYNVELTAEDLRGLDDVSSAITIHGARYSEGSQRMIDR